MWRDRCHFSKTDRIEIRCRQEQEIRELDARLQQIEQRDADGKFTSEAVRLKLFKAFAEAEIEEEAELRESRRLRRRSLLISLRRR